MARLIDRLTEAERERTLMADLRAGRLSRAELIERTPAFPIKVQIQTASTCNASCTMCPWPSTRSRLPQGRMDPALFDELVAQIAGRGVERTSLFLMNEPLLDPRLESFIARVVAVDADTRTVIYTNGERLDAARALALAAAGLHELAVSVVGFTPASHARNMPGVDHQRVVGQLQDVARLSAAGKLGSMTVRVVGLDYPAATEGLDEFTARVGLPVLLKPLTGRAGLVETAAFDPTDRPSQTLSACQRPFVKAYVLYDGRVVLCNCDWERSTIVGDLAHETLEQIWRGATLSAVREAHRSGHLPPDSLCAACDYPYLL